MPDRLITILTSEGKVIRHDKDESEGYYGYEDYSSVFEKLQPIEDIAIDQDVILVVSKDG